MDRSQQDAAYSRPGVCSDPTNPEFRQARAGTSARRDQLHAVEQGPRPLWASGSSSAGGGGDGCQGGRQRVPWKVTRKVSGPVAAARDS